MISFSVTQNCFVHLSIILLNLSCLVLDLEKIVAPSHLVSDNFWNKSCINLCNQHLRHGAVSMFHLWGREKGCKEGRRRKIWAVRRAGVIRRAVSSKAWIGDLLFIPALEIVPPFSAWTDGAQVWDITDKGYMSTNKMVQLRESKCRWYSVGQHKSLDVNVGSYR